MQSASQGKKSDMAQWNRFDIRYAHQALENDWNVGGWLHERPSNQRRMEATHVQLHRLGFSSPYSGGSFGALAQDDELENACDIYIEALIRFGLAQMVRPDDAIAVYVKDRYVNEYAVAHFPQLYK